MGCIQKSHGIVFFFFFSIRTLLLSFIYVYFTCRCIFWINIFRTIKFEEWKWVSLFSHILQVWINWIWRAKGKGDEKKTNTSELRDAKNEIQEVGSEREKKKLQNQSRTFSTGKSIKWAEAFKCFTNIAQYQLSVDFFFQIQ